MSNPLVSCICPVASGHEHFLPQALKCFRAQTYDLRELIVVTRWLPMSADRDENIVWVLPPTDAPNVGASRNWACTVARGEIIAHMDVDDWSAPDRLARQVEALQQRMHPGVHFAVDSEWQILGHRSMLFHWPGSSDAWRFHDDGPCVNLGTSLMYRRSWWEQHRFPEHGSTSRQGEDYEIVRSAAAQHVLRLIDAPDLIVARRHDLNTVKYDPQRLGWTRARLEDLPEGYRATLESR